ncbi:dephospho-CoA kinase [Phytoactinopolyspora halotolerans]|uniref:Dephospho-CoA kinase n=1 Tax=Phytoactinopolyspora halotolerans TaxID=1981512 RepID=A0A6L9SAT7_9ACTN|nr:dephospho-CoA kinase [Phytoactinopolyspora halotolerans]NEE02209.1 dephospho-CoA kinase [Phytoactinopolyspora halotolerans]
MLRVGLTGGIGAGKSTVAGRLGELGAVVIDADELAREVVAPGTPGLEAVVSEFGAGVVAADGTLDRAELGRLVFGSDERRAALNGIIHPLVYRRRSELVAQAPAEAVVVEDIPLLVENGLASSYPLVIVVHAPDEERVRRLTGRGMDADDARSRIRAQADDDARRAAADVWLDNSGPPQRLLDCVDVLWHGRLVPYERNLRERRAASRAPVQHDPQVTGVPGVRPAIVHADPTWESQAGRLIERIRHVTGRRAHRIDHIGSTAVPGLPAKDVLDVQVVVADLPTAGSVADELHEVGFVRMPERWYDVLRDGSERDKAMACNADPARAVNVHVRPEDSPAWRDALLLRDWLRAMPGEAADYAGLKRELAEHTYDSIEEYAELKTPWINAALARADAWAAGRRTGD